MEVERRGFDVVREVSRGREGTNQDVDHRVNRKPTTKGIGHFNYKAN